MQIHYQLEDRPPFGQSIILAIQHILAAFNGIVAVPLIVGSAAGLEGVEKAGYVSAAIFCAGLVTLLQVLAPLRLGARLPCIMGTSFTFVGPSIAVVRSFGLGAMFAATILGSFIEILAGFFIPFIRKLFPRAVTASVVTLIGLSLIPVAVDWMAGGVGARDYGSLENLGIALVTLVFVIILSSSGNRFLKTSAVFIGIFAGYLLCVLLGRVDFSAFSGASYVSIPIPLRYGFSFHWAALLPFLIAYLVTTVETIGDLTATARMAGREITDGQLKGGILCDGVGSLLGGVFGAGANTTFSQNIGIIGITGVASLYVVSVSGVILLILGICPKLGGLVATIPLPVLGGAGLIMFGMIAVVGMSELKTFDSDSPELFVYIISVVLGLSVVFRPGILEGLPQSMQILFSSGITTGGITAVVLNQLMKKRPPREISDSSTEPVEETAV